MGYFPHSLSSVVKDDSNASGHGPSSSGRFPISRSDYAKCENMRNDYVPKYSKLFLDLCSRRHIGPHGRITSRSAADMAIIGDAVVELPRLSNSPELQYYGACSQSFFYNTGGYGTMMTKLLKDECEVKSDLTSLLGERMIGPFVRNKPFTTLRIQRELGGEQPELFLKVIEQLGSGISFAVLQRDKTLPFPKDRKLLEELRTKAPIPYLNVAEAYLHMQDEWKVNSVPKSQLYKRWKSVLDNYLRPLIKGHWLSDISKNLFFLERALALGSSSGSRGLGLKKGWFMDMWRSVDVKSKVFLYWILIWFSEIKKHPVYSQEFSSIISSMEEEVKDEMERGHSWETNGFLTCLTNRFQNHKGGTAPKKLFIGEFLNRRWNTYAVGRARDAIHLLVENPIWGLKFVHLISELFIDFSMSRSQEGLQLGRQKWEKELKYIESEYRNQPHIMAIVWRMKSIGYLLGLK